MVPARGTVRRGHRLELAIAYGLSGKSLAKEKFYPRDVGVYDCAKPVSIGEGEKACP